MKFLVLRAGKSSLKFSEAGFLIGPDSKKLINPENAYFYTYTSGEVKIYHLLVQSGLNLWDLDNSLFFEENALTKALKKHPLVHKESFEVSDVRVEKDNGSLIIDDNKKLIWGSAIGGGANAYEFIFEVPYRKERLLLSTTRCSITKNNEWTFTEEEIDEDELDLKPKIEPAYGIWENNREFWKKYYKRKENTEDTRWGCQKQFLILLAIILIYILYHWIFG